MKCDLKFRVKNETHSKRIQTILFEMGFGWGPSDDSKYKIIQHTDKFFLFADEYDWTITYLDRSSDDDEYFNDQKNFEVVLVHPKQLKFLKGLLNTTLINNIIKNGFYFKKDAKSLNKLLKTN